MTFHFVFYLLPCNHYNLISINVLLNADIVISELIFLNCSNTPNVYKKYRVIGSGGMICKYPWFPPRETDRITGSDTITTRTKNEYYYKTTW